MNNPCENKSYRAKLLLSISFDDLEFSSNQNYEFEVPGNYIGDDFEMEEIVKSDFMEKYKDIFLDTDMSIVVLSINKF